MSVIVIALLGTSSYLSIGFAGGAIIRNGSEMYDSMSFRSVEVVSSMLISEDDVSLLGELDGVKCAEPVWQAGACVYHGEGLKANTYLISLTGRVNVPQLEEGRFPEAPNECAIEQSLAEEMQFRIGDVIDDISMTDDAGQYVLESEFLITGIVKHPDHVSRTFTQTGYIVVPKETFDLETLQGASMKAEILLDGESGDRFSGAHGSEVASLVKKIEELAPERTPLTDAAVKKAAHGRVDAMEADLRQQLERAMSETPDDTETIGYLERSISDLDGYREDIEGMAPSRWIVLGEESSTGYAQIKSCGETLRTLQTNFGLMFIAIGALTILATVGKMVGEQRSQVGTVKALGFFNREILGKYLLFGVSATVFGTIAGCFAGRFLLERIVLDNYKDNFIFDLSAPLFDPVSALIVFAAGIVLSSGAVWIACRTLLRESANALMQPSVPNGVKGKGKDNSAGLYSRLILRNVRSDWKRVLVTVVSILGCCAMIGVGFTLKHAVKNCPEKQYPGIINYDAEVKYEPFAEERFGEILDEAGAERVSLLSTSASVRTDGYGAVKLLVGDIDGLRPMFRLTDAKTGAELPATDEGVFIYQRLAETGCLEVGDEFDMMIGLTDTARVKVAGVFRNYLGMPVVMSRRYYENVFSVEYAPNAFLVRLNGADPEALISMFEEEYGLVSWTESDADRAVFEASMGSIDSVDSLLIAIAAIMAGVVQMCLTSTYVTQKKRELILMRINGFSYGELVGYLLRETVLTALTGIILGIAAGCGIGYYIVRSVELSYTQFDRGVYVPAWLYAAGITALFTVVINAIALRSVKKLKLTDLDA